MSIIADIFKGGGNSLKLRVKSEEVRVGSCEFLSGGRVSSRAVGGSSSSWRFGRAASPFAVAGVGRLFSFILSIAFLFGASSAWAADWTDADGNTYTALKYIKGKATNATTGGGWFVLPFKPNGTDIVKMRFKLATTAWTQFLWCNRAGSSSSSYSKFGAYFDVAGYVQCQRNTGNTAGNTNPGTGECSIEVNYNTLKFYVNGLEQSSSLNSGAFTPPAANTMLFASNKQVSKGSTVNYVIADTIPSSSVSNRGSYYLYDFQIYDSATNLTHNIVPAMRDTDSVTGLYDTATRTFYTKAANSGEFDTEEWGADRAGKKWTGLGGDNKMSTGANWEGGVAPQAGDDIDFTIAVPFAAIEADIDATFGKIYLGTGDLPAFSGELSATGINDLERMTAYYTATDGFTFTLAAPSGQDFTWNGGAAANWSTTDASWLYNSAASVWYDNNNAIFNTAGVTATLTADATANSLTFNQNATVAGTATLTVPTVSVAADVAATIFAPTAGALEKTGAGTLTLGSSRADTTTLSEGTFAMSGSGTTLAWSNFTLGTDAEKPVTLRFEGGAAPSGHDVSDGWNIGDVANVTSTVVKVGGDWSLSNIVRFGRASGAVTEFRHEGGSMNFTSYASIGNQVDAVAKFVISGGAVTNSYSNTGSKYEPRFMIAGADGLVVVTNGAELVVKQHVALGYTPGTKGTLDIYDGTVRVTGAIRFAQYEAGATGVLNLRSGGTLYLGNAYRNSAGSGTFNFDGGTLVKTSDGNLFTNNLDVAVVISSSGGTIDNGGKNITIPVTMTGAGGMAFTGSGKTTISDDQSYLGTTTVSNETTLSVSGGVTLAGPVVFEAGAALDIAGYDGTTPLSATAITFPDEGTVALTLDSGAFDTGVYKICAADDLTAADGEKFSIDTGDKSHMWSMHDNTLILLVGEVDANAWTGLAGDGNLSNPANWYGGAVPASGTATINTTGSLTVGDTFRPDVIVFPETCGAVTIAGENAITGLKAVTNLSVSTCTFEVPVAFADKICVSQGASYGFSDNNPVLKDGGKVRFAGGVTGMSFAEETSRRLDGAFTIPATANWTANSSAELWTVTDGSSLTITDSSSDQPASTDLSWLNNNGAFTTAVIRTSARICVRNEGDYVVTEELAMTVPGADRHIAQRASHTGKYKFEKVTLGDNGNRGNFYFANSGDYYMDKHVYIGKGGLCFADGAQSMTAYAFGRRDNDKIYIYPWHSDYTIGGKGGSTRDVIILKSTYLHTDDENGVARTVTLNGVADVRSTLTVNGHGRLQVNSNGLNDFDGIGNITVADSATLAYAPGADLGAGAVTVGANATMEVASGEHTFEGGLTLNDGATLSFNFTKRTVTPQIAIAEGNTLTVEGAVKVKIPEDSKWPTAGEKILTTCGGFDAEGVTVSLAAGAPNWAKRVYVNADGNIVLDVKPMGTRVIVR